MTTAASVRSLKKVLQHAESFISGFIGDDAQEEPVDDLVAELQWYLSKMKKESPEVFVYVAGGNIQGASATIPLEFTVFDKDNYNVAHEEDREDMGTPEEWDRMIKNKTHKGEIVPVY